MATKRTMPRTMKTAFYVKGEWQCFDGDRLVAVVFKTRGNRWRMARPLPERLAREWGHHPIDCLLAAKLHVGRLLNDRPVQWVKAGPLADSGTKEVTA